MQETELTHQAIRRPGLDITANESFKTCHRQSHFKGSAVEELSQLPKEDKRGDQEQQSIGGAMQEITLAAGRQHAEAPGSAGVPISVRVPDVPIGEIVCYSLREEKKITLQQSSYVTCSPLHTVTTLMLYLV